MKWVLITIIVLTITVLITWVRGGESFHLAQVFPFLGGYEPDIYDAGSLILILITISGLRRIAKRRRDDD